LIKLFFPKEKFRPKPCILGHYTMGLSQYKDAPTDLKIILMLKYYVMGG